MTEGDAGRRLPPVSGLIAGGLVVAGVLLWMLASKAFLFVAGLGAFGPGILRELGLLRDQDEFQREAAHRAGYHAYLTGGMAAAIIASALALRGEAPGDAAEWIRLILLVLWISWMFSALLNYWGAQKTASRVLMTFGSFWALFVIASLIGDAHVPRDVHDLLLGLLGLLVGIGVVAPFFVLARTARRWPRGTGAALLAVSVLFLVVFNGAGRLQWSTVLLTDTLLIVPLIASGGALLREGRPNEPPESDDDRTAMDAVV